MTGKLAGKALQGIFGAQGGVAMEISQERIGARDVFDYQEATGIHGKETCDGSEAHAIFSEIEVVDRSRKNDQV